MEKHDDGPLWLAWEGARRAWLEDKGPSTARAYGAAFRAFSQWGQVPPWQVSPDLARAWARHMAGAGLASSTINQRLAALSSFYQFVMEGYSLATPNGRELSLWPAGRSNPFQAVPRLRRRSRRPSKTPTLAQVRAILRAVNTRTLTGKRDFALLLCLLITCLPAWQVLRLRWSDLRPLPNGDYLAVYRGRDGGRRQARLSRACHQAIRAYLEMDGRPPEGLPPDHPIFLPIDPERVRRLPDHAQRPVGSNQPLSVRSASRILKKYARKAGVDEEMAQLRSLRRAGIRLRRRRVSIQ